MDLTILLTLAYYITQYHKRKFVFRKEWASTKILVSETRAKFPHPLWPMARPFGPALKLAKEGKGTSISPRTPRISSPRGMKEGSGVEEFFLFEGLRRKFFCSIRWKRPTGGLPSVARGRARAIRS